MEVAESYGLPAEDYPELCRELATFDIPVNDVLPSICRSQEVLPEPTDCADECRPSASSSRVNRMVESVFTIIPISMRCSLP